MNDSRAVGLPGLAALWLGFLAFVVALLLARQRAGREARGNTTRSRRSVAGIVVQGLAFFVAGFGGERVTLEPLGAPALAEAAAIAILMGVAVWLFAWSTGTMGRNWSVVARTRDDHALVTSGPFAYLRHPIYAALFLMMTAVTMASGHWPRLIVSAPLYAVGTWLRITVEERMLADLFGQPYRDWSVRVPRFIPRMF